MDVLEEKILNSDDKAIIVSQWTSVLNIVSDFLKQKNVTYDSLNGEVPIPKRQEIVNSFNRRSHDPQVRHIELQ